MIPPAASRGKGKKVEIKLRWLEFQEVLSIPLFSTGDFPYQSGLMGLKEPAESASEALDRLGLD